MKTKLAYVIGALFVASSATAVIAQTSAQVSERASACRDVESAAQADARSTLVSGQDVAISANSLVSVAAGDPLELNSCGDESEGVLRHLSVLPGQRAAYVVDQAGQDVLTVVGPDGSTPIGTAGEVSHPAWSEDGRLVWAENMQVVKVMSADQASVEAIVLPAGAVAVFSPVLTDDAEMTAVVQERVEGARPEDESLNNLWSFDLQERKWTRQTDFEATALRWSAIRTPIMTDTGELLFVRVTANSERTEEPGFELWRSHRGTTTKIESLPREMYLAGVTDGRIVWNAPSRTCGDWGLFEEIQGGFEQIGCGAVMTDPLFTPDPDLLVDEHGDDGAAPSDAADLAILVGDFPSADAARQAAPSLGIESWLASHDDAPSALRPGAWGLIVDVGQDQSSEESLRMVRERLEDCACEAWLVPAPR